VLHHRQTAVHGQMNILMTHHGGHKSLCCYSPVSVVTLLPIASWQTLWAFCHPRCHVVYHHSHWEGRPMTIMTQMGLKVACNAGTRVGNLNNAIPQLAFHSLDYEIPPIRGLWLPPRKESHKLQIKWADRGPQQLTADINTISWLSSTATDASVAFISVHSWLPIIS